MNEETTIESFQSEYRFLSNFFIVPVEYEGIEYASSEHAYQAAKCLYDETKLWIASAPNPGQAKRRGNQVVIRPDWEQVKISVMEEIIEIKFESDPVLRSLLLKTHGRTLIEGNKWGDRFWGQVGGVGENHLGIILMKVRKRIRKRILASGDIHV